MAFFYDGISIKNRRKSNMDSLLLKERGAVENPTCIAAVCDGIGSLPDGAFASSAAVRMLREWFDSAKGPSRMGLQMRDAVQEINRQIVETAQTHELRTGTTLSALLLTDGSYYIVHTGDSRIYACRDDRLIQLTTDQSLNGRLTACLGRKKETDLFYNEGVFRNERFLLCSDGLYKRLEAVNLLTELKQANRKNLRKTVERLTQYAVERGENDNISLAIVLCED